MTRYFVDLTTSVLIPVEAESIEEAKDIAREFTYDKGRDFTELVNSLDFYVQSVEVAEPKYDASVGLAKDHPFDMLPLDEEEE